MSVQVWENRGMSEPRAVCTADLKALVHRESVLPEQGHEAGPAQHP